MRARDTETILQAVEHALRTEEPVDVLMPDGLVLRLTPRRAPSYFAGQTTNFFVADEATSEEPRCQHVSPTPWGWSQCALPAHDERTKHAYSPSEALGDLA